MTAHISLAYDLWPCPPQSVIACDCAVAQSCAPIPSLSLSFCVSPVSLVLSLIVHCALLLIEGPRLPIEVPAALCFVEVWFLCVCVCVCLGILVCIFMHVHVLVSCDSEARQSFASAEYYLRHEWISDMWLGRTLVFIHLAEIKFNQIHREI